VKNIGKKHEKNYERIQSSVQRSNEAVISKDSLKGSEKKITQRR